jgi:hypothetical protein
MTSNAFGGTFAFLQPQKPNKKSKRATKPTRQANSKIDRHGINGQKSTTGNKMFAQWCVDV